MSLSASTRVFATPELLEEILLLIVDWPDDIHERDDPRSENTLNRAVRMRTLLRSQEVNTVFKELIWDSKRLRQALFLQADDRTHRSWQHAGYKFLFLPTSTLETRSRAPMLNPLVQIIFPSYHFRFWHLSLDMSDNRHCAYLIITRRDMAAVRRNRERSTGLNVSRMLISQPPCTTLEAMIWEERDETKDYIGRTSSLRAPTISDTNGLTISYIHSRVAEMFEEHLDIAAIKLTTA